MTYFRATHTDEMCNFYIMYYTDGEATFEECINNQLPQLASTIPRESTWPLPPNPKLEEMAHGHPHHHGNELSSDFTDDKHLYGYY